MVFLGHEAHLSCEGRAPGRIGLQGTLADFLLSWVLLGRLSMSPSLLLKQDLLPSCVELILFVGRAGELCPPSQKES